MNKKPGHRTATLLAYPGKTVAHDLSDGQMRTSGRQVPLARRRFLVCKRGQEKPSFAAFGRGGRGFMLPRAYGLLASVRAERRLSLARFDTGATLGLHAPIRQ